MTETNKHIINGVDTKALQTALETSRHNPDLAMFRFRATNKWIDGTQNETSIDGFYGIGEERDSASRPFIVRSDSPEVLLGKDGAPDPVEILLSALASCVTTSLVFHAAARGIALRQVESSIEGEIDLRGFLGLVDDVRKGFQNIKVGFQVDSDASTEELEELCRFSPVLDNVMHGTEVELSVRKGEPYYAKPIAEKEKAEEAPLHTP